MSIHKRLITKLQLKQDKQHQQELIQKEQIHNFFDQLLVLFYPEFGRCACHSAESDAILAELKRIEIDLFQVVRMFASAKVATQVTTRFLQQLETIFDLLEKDARALFAGDPAATTPTEVIITYPGFYAMAVYRVAHFFSLQKLPVLARILSEYAHGKTGIDIHPGATIGHSFCIDHGTGVVIGETTQIGNHVKIYQGVTLGALSVDKSLANTKRHPTIEDHCVLYAHATILGGQTTIGHHSTIGGNVWLTQSVPPHSLVYSKRDPEIVVRANSRKKPS